MPIWKSLFGKKEPPKDWPRLFEEKTLKDQSRAHVRSGKRRKVNLLCKLDIYTPDGKEKLDTGWAYIADISLSGAFLSKLRLAGGGLPTEPFELLIRVERGPTKGTVFRSVPVGFGSDKFFGLSVRFKDIAVSTSD